MRLAYFKRFIESIVYAVANGRGRDGLWPFMWFNIFASIRKIERSEFDRVFAIIDDLEKVSFIQIGSNDGKQGDPLYKYISRSDRWQGILVEPVRHLFLRLKANYAHRTKLIFENVVISDRSKKYHFYFISPEVTKDVPELPAWYEQLGSLKKKHIKLHISKLGVDIMPYVKRETLPAITLNDLLDLHQIDTLELLHIDTEGHDYRILKQLDLFRIRPLLILVEHKHLYLNEIFMMVLKLRKYYLMYVTAADLLAIRKDLITPGLQSRKIV